MEQCERQEQASGMRSPGILVALQDGRWDNPPERGGEADSIPHTEWLNMTWFVRAWLREMFSFSGFTFPPGLASLLHGNICILFLGLYIAG